MMPYIFSTLNKSSEITVCEKVKSKCKLYTDNKIISRKKYETESRLVREMRKFSDSHGLATGDLMMIYHKISSVLHSASRKLKMNWIGPLRIQAILDDTHCLVSDWTGQLIPE